MMQSRRLEREKRARYTTSRAIPDLLRGSPRAKHGIARTELIVDPQPPIKSAACRADAEQRTDLTIRIESADPLQLASRSSRKPYAGRQASVPKEETEEDVRNVAVHNMASLDRPGAGFLAGKNGQEEFLCTRTTLYASLNTDLYPLPDLGGIFTPDVLVFRDVNGIDVPKRDRFFIDVISAGVQFHPENGVRYDGEESACSCGISYCDRDRDLVTRKMKAVLRMAQAKGAKKLILGAWGCGMLNHPVKEVAKLWRKVIAGSHRQRRPNVEQWEGIDEIIFSIPNAAHAMEFRHVFDDVLAPELVQDDSSSSPGVVAGDDPNDAMAGLIASAKSLELQIEQARNAFVKSRLREDLLLVNHEMAHGRSAAHAAAKRDASDEDVEDGFVVDGYPGSDGEDTTFFRVGRRHHPDSDDHTCDSDSSSAPRSETFEFRFGRRAGGYDSQASQDDDDDYEDELEDEEGCFDEVTWTDAAPSAQFDPHTGWFQGSIDELSAHLHGGAGGKRQVSGTASPRRDPLVLRRESSAALMAPRGMVNEFLARFQRSE